MSDTVRDLQIEGEAARALLANIRDVIGDDEEMIATAVEGETGLVEIISEAVNRIAQLNAHCEAIVQQVSALKTRGERFEGQADRLRAAIHAAMGHANLRKLELPQATLSIRAVPPKVEITSEADIPAKFWIAQDPKLDKKAVLAALKAKEDVPGAALSNGGETLSCRGG